MLTDVGVPPLAAVSEQAPFIASESFAASSLDFPSEWLQFRNRGG